MNFLSIMVSTQDMEQKKQRQSRLTLPFCCVINTNIVRLYEQGADYIRIGQYALK